MYSTRYSFQFLTFLSVVLILSTTSFNVQKFYVVLTFFYVLGSQYKQHL